MHSRKKDQIYYGNQPPLLWLHEAEKHFGIERIPGPYHNKTIESWLVRLGAWWRDDDTPYSGSYVAHCLTEAGYHPPAYWFRSEAYMGEWGYGLTKPAFGCVAVFYNKKFERQVGFIVGDTGGVRDTRKFLMVTGDVDCPIGQYLVDFTKVASCIYPPYANGGIHRPERYRYQIPLLKPEHLKLFETA